MGNVIQIVDLASKHFKSLLVVIINIKSSEEKYVQLIKGKYSLNE